MEIKTTREIEDWQQNKDLTQLWVNMSDLEDWCNSHNLKSFQTLELLKIIELGKNDRN